MSREDLRAHLDYFRDLGVDGVSRSPEWRIRTAAAAAPSGDAAGDGAVVAATAGPDPSGPAASAAASLAALAEHIGPACTRCKLHRWCSALATPTPS
jgi:hypothetical protein